MVVEATKTVDSGDELSETCEQAVETESINLTAVNEDAKELAVEPTGSSNTTKEPQTSEPMEQGSNITDNEKVDLSAEIEPEDMEDGELSEDDGDKGEITPTTSSTDGIYITICLICVVTPNQYNRANYNCNYRPVVQRIALFIFCNCPTVFLRSYDTNWYDNVGPQLLKNGLTLDIVII